ncbi:MAG: DNA replication/repair protein RecF, partial [Bacteroidetes bacterium]
LARAKLVHFKNYTQTELRFSPQLNFLVGDNGMGKTNLLDAIYYLCMGKSYFALSDAYLVQQGADFFRLEGDFVPPGADRPELMLVKVVPRQRKELICNGRRYEKIAEHVGRYPVVIVVPDDTLLILEGSAERRKLLDNTLSQLDPAYLQQLLTYNRLLKQRNALLKQFAGRTLPTDLIQVYDQQLLAPATAIHQARRDFLERFWPDLQHAHQAICHGRERVTVTYRSGLQDQDFADLLAASLEKDRILERTTQGIHRDDLVFKLDGQPLKRMGSQGQLKSFVLALKLAQFRFLRAASGKTPLLLLDDIFDKLDPHRVAQLMTYLRQEAYGQVFLTDTDPQRLASILAQQQAEATIFTIKNGRVQQLDEEE